MTSDANALSRHYIASQTSHRTGNPLEVITRPRRSNWWVWFINASALAGWTVIGLIVWVGTGH